MGYIEDNLNPGEKITLEAGLSLAMFIGPGFLALFLVVPGLLILLLSTRNQYPVISCIAIFFVLLGLASIINSIIVFNTTDFAVTDKRIIAKTGFLRRRSLEILLTKVESILVNQSIAGRIFNYGVIVVVGTGGTKESFPYINDPMEFRKRINAQITGLV
jgi:uncharacterized membrane protein YdbT with pleckstrin-like domain